jgi:hypothetical protein
MTELLSDYPKLECPFVRQDFKITRESFKTNRSKHHLRKPEVYLVTPEVNPGYEWVFEDADTIAVEKLDGTNVKIKTENNKFLAVQNRKNIIDPLLIVKGRNFFMEGLWKSADKGYIKPDGEQAGELLGPKLQGNPFEIDYHIWYPFDKAVSSLRYNSFNKHEPTFENLSSWFKDFLFSRLYDKLHKKNDNKKMFAEGVVFYNFKRKEAGQVYRAKLRRDMFEWFYEGIELIK